MFSFIRFRSSLKNWSENYLPLQTNRRRMSPTKMNQNEEWAQQWPAMAGRPPSWSPSYAAMLLKPRPSRAVIESFRSYLHRTMHFSVCVQRGREHNGFRLCCRDRAIHSGLPISSNKIKQKSCCPPTPLTDMARLKISLNMLIQFRHWFNSMQLFSGSSELCKD